jgi:hypothetical protein
MAASSDQDLTLRILVTNPPPDVDFLVQRGRGDLTPAAAATRARLTFEVPVRVRRQPGGAPNFLGPYAQGPPQSRFVYVNSGTYAGQSDSCWSRRAKVPLTAITWALVERAIASSGVLEVEFPGTGRDGGPTCATVKLAADAWRVGE